MCTEKLFVMSFMVLKSPFLSSMCSYFIYSYCMIKPFLLQEWSKLLEIKKHCALGQNIIPKSILYLHILTACEHLLHEYDNWIVDV